MKEYEVTVTVQTLCETLTVRTKVDAYSEEEAKENAKQQVRDNMIVYAEDVELLSEEEGMED